MRRLESWVVNRPAQVDEVVRALRDVSNAIIIGEGGSGTSTVARMVCADRRVRRRFRGRVHWVTLARDTRGPALAAKINELVRQIDPALAVSFADVRQATAQLQQVLAADRGRLVVVDGAWFEDQVAAFSVVGRSARLVTTSKGFDGSKILVDPMPPRQARAVLRSGLSRVPARLVRDLADAAGHRPLPLRLINRFLALHDDRAGAAAGLLHRLPREGTIAAVTAALSAGDRDRLAELAVFAENHPIPYAVAAALWRTTGDLDLDATRELCARLDGRALVTLTNGTLRLHSVVREFLRATIEVEKVNDALIRSLPETDDYLHDHLIEHLVAAGRGTEADALLADLTWITARLRQSGPAGPLADLARVGTDRAVRLHRLWEQNAHLLTESLSVVDILYTRIAHDPDWGPQIPLRRLRPALVPRWPMPDLPDPDLLHSVTLSRGSATAVAIAPDGTWLAIGSRIDWRIQIWDLSVSGARPESTYYAGQVGALAIAPDGTWLASAEEATIRIWSRATGRTTSWLPGDARTTALAIAPDGTWLASAGDDGRIRIWDVTTARQRTDLPGHDGLVSALAIAPDGTWLASAGEDGEVRITDVATGRVRIRLDSDNTVRALAIAPSGKWLAGGTDDGGVRSWYTTTGRVRRRPIAHTGRSAALTITADGTRLVTTPAYREVKLWNVPRRRPERGHHTGHVTAVAIAPDGTWLAVGTRHAVRMWDAATSQERGKPISHLSPVTAVAIGPDGTWLAGSDRGAIRIWDAATGRQRLWLGSWHVHALAIAPDGTWLASADDDGSIRIWDTDTGRERAVLNGQGGRLAAVAIAPDGTWLAGGGSWGTVWIWDLATRPARVRLPDHRGEVTAVAIAPDGTWLASADGVGVRIWDAATGLQRHKLEHTWSATAVTISPDGTWLACGGSDGSILVWNTAGGEPVAAMKVDGTVESCTFAPDGRSLAVGGSGGLYYFAWRP